MFTVADDVLVTEGTRKLGAKGLKFFPILTLIVAP